MVKELKVKLGDKVSEGSVILTLDSAARRRRAKTAAPAQPLALRLSSAHPRRRHLLRQAQPATAAPAGAATVTAVKVPDIGDFKDVPVIEVFVKVGDTVKAEDSLVSLESEKATMDVPAPAAGVVKELKVKLGDKVSEGTVILMLEAAGGASRERTGRPPRPIRARTPAPLRRRRAAPPDACVAGRRHSRGTRAAPVDSASFKSAHASPSVRAFARELGVDLSRVKGTGPKERILQEDVQKFVKGVMSGATAGPAAAAAGGAGGKRRWACCRGRRWTSASSARSRASRCRESRRSPAPTCIATG